MNVIKQQINDPLVTTQPITEHLYNHFLAYIDAKPKTVETYTRALRQFFQYLSIHGISKPARKDILAFREGLKDAHKPATVQNYIVAVRLFFRWTAQEGLYPNIAEHIKGAKLDPGHKKDYMTAPQVKNVLQQINRNTVAGKRDYAILSLMVTTGLRTIEVVRANIEDLRPAGDNVVLYVQGKGQDEKTEYVKIARETETAIRAYLAAFKPLEKKCPLFTSVANKNAGHRLTTRSVSRIVKTRMQDAGYDSDRLTAHSLRHTAGTLNLLNGGSLEETQQLLRHSNINTTMIYAHHLQRAQNNSEQRIATAIFEE